MWQSCFSERVEDNRQGRKRHKTNLFGLKEKHIKKKSGDCCSFQIYKHQILIQTGFVHHFHCANEFIELLFFSKQTLRSHSADQVSSTWMRA